MRIFFTLLLFFSTPAVAGELFLSTFGVTYHGQTVNEELADHMPHKITEDGKWIYHPIDFSVMLKLENSMQLNATYLEDCFGQKAGLLGVGQYVSFWRLSVGYLAGLYVREKFVFKDKRGNDASPADMLFYQEQGDTQYIPMAFLTSTVRLKATEPYIDLLLAGNWYLNHMEMGVGFGW